MYELVIKQNKTIPKTSFIVFLCEAFVFGGYIWVGIKDDRTDLIWLTLFMAAIAAIIHIYFLLKYWFWRVELGPYGCCYRNRFGKRREFQIRDVKQIGLRQKYISLVKYQYLELMDQRGKIIVSISLLTAENVNGLIPFFEKYSTEVVIDENGRVAVASRMPELQDHVNRGSERQINHWRETNRKWGRKPAFYQNPVWMARIRKIGYGLYALMFAGIIAAQLGSRTVASLVYAIIPLILMLYFLLFHRVLAWRAPRQTTRDWEEAHVVIPNITLTMFLFFFWCPLLDLSFTLDAQIQFWGRLCALLLIVFGILVVLLKAWGKIPGLILFVLIYSYTGIYCWNHLFTPEQVSVREEFTILEKSKVDLWKFSQYQILVYSENEGEIPFHVSFDTYKATEPQDKITFCIKESLFGVDYCCPEEAAHTSNE